MIGKNRIRISAYLFVKNAENKVLMTRTQAGPRQIWNLPGGAMDWGESIEQSLQRELREELSLDVEIDNLLHLTRGVHINPDFPNSQLLGCYFAAKHSEKISNNMHSGEHGQDVLNIQWLDPEELDPNEVLSVDVEFFKTQNIEVGKKFNQVKESFDEVATNSQAHSSEDKQEGDVHAIKIVERTTLLNRMNTVTAEALDNEISLETTQSSDAQKKILTQYSDLEQKKTREEDKKVPDSLTTPKIKPQGNPR